VGDLVVPDPELLELGEAALDDGAEGDELVLGEVEDAEVGEGPDALHVEELVVAKVQAGKGRARSAVARAVGWVGKMYLVRQVRLGIAVTRFS
jgi:hypothetical protein